MRLATVLRHRLRALFLGRRLDADAREELAAHLDRQIELNRASGMSDDEARRAARLEIGNPAPLAEACREARGLAWWDALTGDVRYGLRQLRRRPGFSIAAVVTLALGVGATSAVFAVVDAVVLRPLPYPEADRLYALYEINSRANVGRTRTTALNFLDWNEQSRTFAGMAAHVGTGYTLTGQGDPVFVLGQVVTPNLLDVLRVRPAIGRGFMPHETEAGSHRVVILAHGLWQRHFGGDPRLVGRTISINAQPYEVIGVMPPSFGYPMTTYELWTPLVTRGTVSDAPPINRGARYLRVVGRLTDGVTADTARRELDVIGARLAQAYADTNETVSIGMASLADDTIGEAEDRLVVLLVAVGFVLLIACINVAGLAIARGTARGRELAVRAAVGASSGRLIRQLATESLLVFALGGVGGLLLAGWVISAFVSALPATIPRSDEIAIDWRFIAFSGTVTLVAGLLSSILPALSIAARAQAAELSGSRVISPARSTQRTRAALIVAQVAAAVVLLAGAALALRSFDLVRRADPGFEAERALTFTFVMRADRYASADALRDFSSRVSDALGALSGVEAAGLATHLPLSDQNFENGFEVDGSPVEDAQDPPIAGVRGVAGQYREAIGARLLQGRDLRPADTERAQLVVVVTENFVKRYVRSGEPIGARLRMGGADASDPWYTIVGVIADIRHAALDEQPRPEVWFPYAQLPDALLTRWLRGMFAAARTSIDLESLAPSVRSMMSDLDPSLPLRELQPMSALAYASTAERRLETYLLSAFAAIAMVLAAVGLFGVLAFYVTQHVQEFGVRLALGATPRALLKLVLTRAFALLAAGLAVGLPAAVLMGRGMSGLLYGVEPADPLAFSAAIAMLTLVMLVACALPARRAMMTDPLGALRVD